MAMAFRHYHAFAGTDLKTQDGLPTFAVFGCIRFVLKLLETERPDYLVFVTDSRELTFRHEIYPDYKANRAKTPENLLVQLPCLFEFIDALGLPLYKQAGVEADDLIGSLVTKYAKETLHCLIVSGDKDFMQLITPHVSLYSPKKGGSVKIINTEEVQEKFGCSPDQVVDMLAIIGDRIDNIPGVRGLGEKGAKKLIQTYGSLTNIYENLSSIQNQRSRLALEKYREIAFLSKKLVSIKTDITLEIDFTKSMFHQHTYLANSKLFALYTKLELRTLADKVQQEINHVSPSAMKKEASVQSYSKNSVNYQTILTKTAWDELLQKLTHHPLWVLDSETTGLSILDDEPIGFSFSMNSKTAFYVPLLPKHLTKDLTKQDVLEGMQELLQNFRGTIVGHNLKFDLHMITNLGLMYSGKIADTMIASYLLDSIHGYHSLDACCLRYLDYRKIPTSDLIGKKREKSMKDLHLEQLSCYACEDADLTLRLYEVFLEKLEKICCSKLYETIECPLVRVLMTMEREGVFVHAESLHNFSKSLDEEMTKISQEIYQQAGEIFNIHSTKQLQVILYEKLKIHEKLHIKNIKKTKSGLSTDVSMLEKLSEHPLPRVLLQYRSLSKLKNTYVDTLPQLIHTKTNRIHTNFHQTITATGRLSSSRPNLQNIPIRTPMGKRIRQAFCPQSKNRQMIAADYSQIELRILAHLSDDPGLKQAFLQGVDIHQETAARIFNVPPKKITREMRAQAKSINFGIIYGMGARRLSQQTGLTFAMAKAFIEKYFDSFPEIRRYIEKAVEFAREHGFSRTIFGRRRPIPELSSNNKLTQINGEHIAVNSPIQGSAADIVKKSMINIQGAFEDRGYQSKLVLQIHDELLFEAPVSEIKNLLPIIREQMESVCLLNVPLVVDIGVGDNWLEAH